MPERIEQDCHSFAVNDTLEQAKGFRKDAFEYASLFAGSEDEADAAIVRLCCQSFNFLSADRIPVRT
jgi:hypothetical protein